MENLNDTNQDDEHQEPIPTSTINMSDGSTQTTVFGFGDITMAVQGGNIIHHDAAGTVIPEDASGVRYPAPGVAVYGDNVAVNTHPEAHDNQ